MAIRTYDPSQVVVSVNGIPVSGFADGTGVKVSRSNNLYEKVNGMDGHTSRSKSMDRSGEISITLAQTSPSNTVFSTLAMLDETSNAGVCIVAITDLSGSSQYATASAWIRKPADAEFGKTISNREWVFECVALSMFSGGTAEQ
jgi:hypothetical protein